MANLPVQQENSFSCLHIRFTSNFSGKSLQEVTLLKSQILFILMRLEEKKSLKYLFGYTYVAYFLDLNLFSSLFNDIEL